MEISEFYLSIIDRVLSQGLIFNFFALLFLLGSMAICLVVFIWFCFDKRKTVSNYIALFFIFVVLLSTFFVKSFNYNTENTYYKLIHKNGSGAAELAFVTILKNAYIEERYMGNKRLNPKKRVTWSFIQEYADRNSNEMYLTMDLSLLSLGDADRIYNAYRHIKKDRYPHVNMIISKHADNLSSDNRSNEYFREFKQKVE